MNTRKLNTPTLLSIICSVLLLVVFLMQFIPFWQYGEHNELSCSINGYVWFPTDHDDLTQHLQTVVREDYEIEQILVTPIASMILSALGCVLCLVKREHPLMMLFPLSCGIVGVFGYLSEPVLRLGSGWGIHLLLYIALLVLSVYSLLPYLKAIAALISERLHGRVHDRSTP